MDTMRIRRYAVMIALAVAAAAPAAAAAQGPRVPQARMDAFLQAIQPRDSLLGFFPRRGTWTWVQTTRQGGEARVGRWRFASADLPRAMEHPGPLCELFSTGGDVRSLRALGFQDRGGEDRPWQRVAANRFAKPGTSSPTHVQWRREDGRWVVDAIHSEVERGPPLPGRELTEVVRDLGGPPPADETYAAGASWYESNQPIVAGGARLDKYGLPRAIAADLLRRYGFVNGVAAYAEAGTEREKPSVLYVPVSAGMYQPYQFMSSSGCP